MKKTKKGPLAISPHCSCEPQEVGAFHRFGSQIVNAVNSRDYIKIVARLAGHLRPAMKCYPARSHFSHIFQPKLPCRYAKVSPIFHYLKCLKISQRRGKIRKELLWCSPTQTAQTAAKIGRSSFLFLWSSLLYWAHCCPRALLGRLIWHFFKNFRHHCI